MVAISQCFEKKSRLFVKALRFCQARMGPGKGLEHGNKRSFTIEGLRGPLRIPFVFFVGFVV